MLLVRNSRKKRKLPSRILDNVTILDMGISHKTVN